MNQLTEPPRPLTEEEATAPRVLEVRAGRFFSPSRTDRAYLAAARDSSGRHTNIRALVKNRALGTVSRFEPPSSLGGFARIFAASFTGGDTQEIFLGVSPVSPGDEHASYLFMPDGEGCRLLFNGAALGRPSMKLSEGGLLLTASPPGGGAIDFFPEKRALSVRAERISDCRPHPDPVRRRYDLLASFPVELLLEGGGRLGLFLHTRYAWIEGRFAPVESNFGKPRLE